MKKIVIINLFLGAALQGYSQAKLQVINPPALASIKETDLKRDIFELAGDAFRGRRAGSVDEMRAAAWVAQKAQEAGLKPAGDDGTYFQYFNLRRTRTADRSLLEIGGRPLKMGEDFWLTQPVDAHLNGTIISLNSMADTATADLTGKIVALKIEAPKPLPAAGMSLWEFRYTSSAIRQQSTVLRRKGVAAVIFIANDITEKGIAFIGHNYEDGSYQNVGLATANRNNNRNTISKPIPIILIRSGLEIPGKQAVSLKADIYMETYLYPSVNVIAKAPGGDLVLRNEYVLFSGHHDHDGIGNPVGLDSIWNGADDNASVTVGMLAIGRAWVEKPGKRSALFVWHGAEERGLLGSRWYAVNPTVKKESIVAVLNGDMIGRNSIDSAALLGSIAPHRNSIALVDMAMQANKQLTKFTIDTSWDVASHPENWYFRSDHAPYAQAGMPAIFFTSLLHPDYHTPKDEPERISIPKLTKMTRWMYATGWLVSQTVMKPALDVKPL
ncbi:M28 family metallopeptidase [Mucilaginibacter terrae]|uniref:M28 family metallopeptidase n=1 Tax=Mucilaginibacter terrae TaxID=1955052 RepID=UPI003629BF98